MKSRFNRFFYQIVNYYGVFFHFLKPMITVFLRNLVVFFHRKRGIMGVGVGDRELCGGEGEIYCKRGNVFFSFNFQPIIKYLFDFLPKKTYISQKHVLSALKVDYVLNHIA